MKKTFRHLLAAFMATAMILLAGCEKPDKEDNNRQDPDTEEKTPAVIIDETGYHIGPEGGDLSVSYTIENPAETGRISAETETGWIHVGTVSTSTIELTADANNITETRTADVNIIYTYGENSDTVSRLIHIEQDAMIPDPEIIIGIEGNITVPSEGGDFDIPFSISYPVENGTVTAETEAEWLTAGAISESNAAFTAAENQSASERSATITLVYTYNGDRTVSAEINVIQEAMEVSVDYYLPEAYSYAEYYDYGEIFRYFRIQFSDKEIVDGSIAEGACSYDLTIYVSDIEDSSNPVPPDGTYIYSSGLTPGSFSGWFYPNTSSTGSGIQDGTMEVTKDGEYLLIEINLTDVEGKTHYVKYYGIPSYDIAFQI